MEHTHTLEVLGVVFRDMCDIVGTDPSEEQVQRLTQWVIDNVGFVMWDDFAELALDHGVQGVYTELRMRRSEMGV